MKKIKDEHLLKLRGVLKIFRTKVSQDDILIFNEIDIVKLPMLRGQTKDSEYRSVTDFLNKEEDYICLFALTAGIGLKEIIEGFKENGDDYSAIMSKLLADRLTEAFAEKLHLDVREKIWGFEKETEKNISDIIKGRYQGCRIAIGYPAIPDHSLKTDIFRLLDAERLTGMHLTENYMITPEESLCGLILARGEYFNIGKIGDDQIADYAARRGKTKEEMRKWLIKNI